MGSESKVRCESSRNQFISWEVTFSTSCFRFSDLSNLAVGTADTSTVNVFLVMFFSSIRGCCNDVSPQHPDGLLLGDFQPSGCSYFLFCA